VPAATIRHYLREGLLPGPAKRTSRNMAYYDAALVDRIRRIKELQREHFLPLSVIKEVMSGRRSVPDDETAARAIARVLERSDPGELRSRAELLASGADERELDWFLRLGLVTPRVVEGDERYGGDDLSLLRVLGAARRAGIREEMLPTSLLARYVEAIGELVRTELEMFRAGVLARATEDIGVLTEVATTLSERLVVLIRRKLLLPTLERVVREAQQKSGPPRGTPRAGKKKKRAPSSGKKLPSART